MLVDCPVWVRHGNDAGINGLDVSPNGRRLATCGTDPQIIIWSMQPILDAAAEADPSTPKVLAVLQEHQNYVLTVRFSNSGSLLASGSGDASVLVFKRSPTPATQKLGVKFTNKENWRPVCSLKGHSLDVTGLSWAPGDAFLASSSMDGNVLLFKMDADGRGQLVHTIEQQHNGWVKGLAFDPRGRYLATQGRNGLKVWDVHAGYGLAAHIRERFERAPDAGFKYRMSWSPDGELLFAVNSASGQQLSFCIVNRGTWVIDEASGHRGAVLVAAANPKLFYPPVQLLAHRQQQGEEQGEGEAVEQQQQQGEANGGGFSAAAANAAGAKQQQQQQQQKGPVRFAEEACVVLAVGSNDKSLTLWDSCMPRPFLQLSQLHSGSIMDLAWTPDGYTLLAAGQDDRVSVMRFAQSELGKALTPAEFQAVLQAEYGTQHSLAATTAAAGGEGAADGTMSNTGAAGGADATTAAAAAGGDAGLGLDLDLQQQAQHELQQLAQLGNPTAAMDAVFPTPPRPTSRTQKDAALPAGPEQQQQQQQRQQLGVMVTPPKAAAAAAVRDAPVRRLAPQPVGSAAAASGGAAAAAGALERRLMPQGAGITTGSLGQQQQQAGRKRPHAAAAAAGAAAAAFGQQQPPKRLAAAPVQQQQQQQLVQHRQQQLAARGAAAAAVGRAGGSGSWVLPVPPPPPKLQAQLALVCVAHTAQQQQQQQQQYQSLQLVVDNKGSSSSGRAEVSLHLGGTPGTVVWRDTLQEQVVAVAGSMHFSAAATASGLLFTWRSGGNPLLPPLALGCPPVSLTAEGDWELLLLGADGALITLDLNSKQRLLSGSLPPPNVAPLLAAAAPGTSIQDAWVTSNSSSSGSNGDSCGSSGLPQLLLRRTQVVVLTDSSAWWYHQQLGYWVMIKAPLAPHNAAVHATTAAAAAPAAAAGDSSSGDAGKLRAAAAAAAAAGVQPPLLLPGLQGGRVVGPDPGWQRLEAYCQLFGAEVLGDVSGYQRWLGLLVALLARQRETTRLSELAQDLLGPTAWDPSWPPLPWDPHVLGSLSKRSLLGNVLVPAVAREGLPLASQVHNALKAAQEYAVAQAAAAAAAGQQGHNNNQDMAAAQLGRGLRLGPAAAPAAAAVTGANAAAAAEAVPDLLFQQQQQEADGLSGVGHNALSGGPAAAAHGDQITPAVTADVPAGAAATPVRHSSQQQQQQQQLEGLNGLQKGLGKATVGGAHTPRRLQPRPVAPQPGVIATQQQQLQSPAAAALVATAAAAASAANGVEGAVRVPLQEQQQQQLPPGKQQQQQPPEKPSAAAVLGAVANCGARSSS